VFSPYTEVVAGDENRFELAFGWIFSVLVFVGAAAAGARSVFYVPARAPTLTC